MDAKASASLSMVTVVCDPSLIPDGDTYIAPDLLLALCHHISTHDLDASTAQGGSLSLRSSPPASCSVAPSRLTWTTHSEGQLSAGFHVCS